MVSKLGKVGVTVCAVFLGLAVIAFILPRIDSIYIAAYGRDPDAARFEPPSMKHPLGTGCMRGDIFSKVCSGAYYAFLREKEK